MAHYGYRSSFRPLFRIVRRLQVEEMGERNSLTLYAGDFVFAKFLVRREWSSGVDSGASAEQY